MKQKLLSLLLVLALVFTMGLTLGTADYHSAISDPCGHEDSFAHAATGDTSYYHLDIGIYCFPYVQGKWLSKPYGSGTDTITKTITFGREIEVQNVYTMDEFADRWNWEDSVHFTHNIPKTYDGKYEKGYRNLYKLYKSTGIKINAFSGEGKNVTFSYTMNLKADDKDYDVAGIYNMLVRADAALPLTTVMGFKELGEAEIASLQKELAAYARQILVYTLQGDLGNAASAKEKYLQVRNKLSSAGDWTDKNVDATVTAGTSMLQGYQAQVYQFWGGRAGLEAQAASDAGSAAILKAFDSIFTMQDTSGRTKLYIVFMPIVIEYKPVGTICPVCNVDIIDTQHGATCCADGGCPLYGAKECHCTKVCSVCGKCILTSGDKCADGGCGHFGTPDCGCYKPTACTSSYTWNEVRPHKWYCGAEDCSGHTCNHVYTYTAALTGSASITPAKPNGAVNGLRAFKSGYGFGLTTTQTVSVKQVRNFGTCGDSYAKAYTTKVTLPTAAEVRTGWVVKYADTKKTQAAVVTLAGSGGAAVVSNGSGSGSASCTFTAKANPMSAYKNKLIYTAVELSGTKKKPGKHHVDVYSCGGKVGSHELCLLLKGSATPGLQFYINGNMYEDDWSVDSL